MNNRKPIITYEFGVLCDKDHCINTQNSNSIPHKSFENLWNFVLENQGSSDFQDAMSVHSKGGRRYIKIGRYIGTIQTRDGLTIEILPKIYTARESNKDNADLCRKVFLKMLSSFHDTYAKTFQDASLNTQKDFPILEVYIGRYLDEVGKLFVSGIKKNYIFVEENQKFLKGKLQIHRQICKNSTDKTKFAVKYLKYSEDIPQNRIIVSTLHKLSSISRVSSNVCRCYTLLNVLSEIPASKNIPYDLSRSLNSNRLFAEYKDLILWSSQFLLNKGFTIFSGNYVNQSLLFSAEKLFESFIASLFKKYAKEYFKKCLVATQSKKYFLIDRDKNSESGRFRLKPDIVIENNTQNTSNYQITIIDTKWKNLDSQLPGSNYLIDIKDMYQLYAYGQKYHLGDSYIFDTIPNLILIYPYTEKFKNELKPFVYEEIKKKYGLELTVFPFNLAECENNGYKKQILKILETSSRSSFLDSKANILDVESEIDDIEVIRAQDRYMLIGYYKDEKHLKWILENKLYNVRYDGKREGSLKGSNAIIVPSRIVLYNNLKEPRVFIANKSGIILANREKMKFLNYPTDDFEKEKTERYKLFPLGEEIKSFKKIDISKLIDENVAKGNNHYAPFFIKY